MESDIVERLRFWSDQAKEQDATDVVIGLCQAADEIERLRAELADARQIIFRLQTFAACCRTSPAATTRDGEAPHEPEAL